MFVAVIVVIIKNIQVRSYFIAILRTKINPVRPVDE